MFWQAAVAFGCVMSHMSIHGKWIMQGSFPVETPSHLQGPSELNSSVAFNSEDPVLAQYIVLKMLRWSQFCGDPNSEVTPILRWP